MLSRLDHPLASRDGLEYWNRHVMHTLTSLQLTITYTDRENYDTFLTLLDWNAVEAALDAPLQACRLCVQLTSADAFKAGLDAVINGDVLQRFRTSRRVDVRFGGGSWNYFSPGISMAEVLALRTAYIVDGHHIILTPAQRFKM